MFDEEEHYIILIFKGKVETADNNYSYFNETILIKQKNIIQQDNNNINQILKIRFRLYCLDKINPITENILNIQLSKFNLDLIKYKYIIDGYDICRLGVLYKLNLYIIFILNLVV